MGVRRVAKSWTQLRQFTTHTHTHTLPPQPLISPQVILTCFSGSFSLTLSGLLWYEEC